MQLAVMKHQMNLQYHGHVTAESAATMGGMYGKKHARHTMQWGKLGIANKHDESGDVQQPC